MKKLLTICALLIVTATTFAQPSVPSRPFAIEPTISDDNNSICQVLAVWERSGKSPRVTMLANFAQDGGLEKIEVTLYRADADSASFVYPRQDGDWAMEFKNKDNWTKFAKDMRTRFAVVSDNLYVEADAYKVTAVTRVLDGFEGAPDMECLILKNKFRTISVPMPRWVGRSPEEGETIHLGRERVFTGAFFAVEKAAYGGYILNSSTMDELREYRKSRERLAAK